MQRAPTPAFVPFKVLFRDREIVVAEMDHLCIVIWRGAVTKFPFEKQRAGLASVVERYANRAGFLCVIEPSAKPPSDELRRESTQMLEGHAERLRCVGMVIEGEGFRAAITRGVLSGMLLLMPHRKANISFFPNTRPAATWMKNYVEIASPDALATTVEEIRSRILPQEATR
jgi:hypothetical protein